MKKFKVTYNVCSAEECQATEFGWYGKEQAVEETEADTVDEAIDNIMDYIIYSRDESDGRIYVDKDTEVGTVTFYVDADECDANNIESAVQLFNFFEATEI